MTQKGTNLAGLKELNRSLALRLIRRLKICSRAQISKETGLKQATITKIVKDLINLDIVTETGIINGEKGRRSIGITLKRDKYKVICLRLTRNYYSTALVDLSGKLDYLATEPIDIFEGPAIALKNMEKSIIEIIKKNFECKIIGLGLAVPGPYFKSEGVIGYMSEFPGWEKIHLEKEIKSFFKLPVYIEHDANAGALAEWFSRPHNNKPGTMVYITAGQGIGSSVIVDGKLLQGSQGIAGELGHTSIDYNGIQCSCGLKGCLEQYCSAFALVREVRNGLKDNPESILNQKYDFDSFVQAVKENDRFAVSVLKKTSGFLAIGLANVINIFNPDLIIIGDELSRFGSKLLKLLKKELRKVVLPQVFNNVSIEISNFKNDSALIGAGELVIDNLLQKPSLLKKIL